MQTGTCNKIYPVFTHISSLVRIYLWPTCIIPTEPTETQMLRRSAPEEQCWYCCWSQGNAEKILSLGAAVSVYRPEKVLFWGEKGVQHRGRWVDPGRVSGSSTAPPPRCLAIRTVGKGRHFLRVKSATPRSAIVATEMTGLRKTNPEGRTPGAGHLHFAVYMSFQVPSERLNLVQAFRSTFTTPVASALI